MPFHRLRRLSKDPFRLLFPLGWLVGLVGVGAWLPFPWWEGGAYPGGFHAVLMARGFVGAFVLGFLMTAFPRFTQTPQATPGEWGLAALTILGAALLAPFGRGPWASVLGLGQVVLMGRFLLHRFFRRKANPPSSFVFVGAAFGMATVGLVLEGMAGWESWELAPEAVWLGREWSFYGWVMALVLGVGSRLVPGILGWAQIVQGQRAQYEQAIPFWRAVPGDLWLSLAGFVVSFGVEMASFARAGRCLRTAVVGYLLVRYWRVHRTPPENNWMKRGVRWAGFALLGGEALGGLYPEWGVDGRHITFVGGFSLLILLVGARVTLAHGPGLGGERSVWPYGFFGVLVGAAALGRLGARWSPETYFPHLAYAGGLWLIALGVWGFVFVPEMIRGSADTTTS